MEGLCGASLLLQVGHLTASHASALLENVTVQFRYEASCCHNQLTVRKPYNNNNDTKDSRKNMVYLWHPLQADDPRGDTKESTDSGLQVPL